MIAAKRTSVNTSRNRLPWDNARRYKDAVPPRRATRQIRKRPTDTATRICNAMAAAVAKSLHFTSKGNRGAVSEPR